MLWRRALALWVAMAVVEIVHGVLRGLWLVPLVGDWRARQVGAIVGTALVLAVAAAGIGWLGTRCRSQLWRVGLLWVGLMMTFEVLAGRWLAGFTWARIWSDYDLAHGGLLGLGMIVLLCAPLIAARLRDLPLRG